MNRQLINLILYSDDAETKKAAWQILKKDDSLSDTFREEGSVFLNEIIGLVENFYDYLLIWKMNPETEKKERILMEVIQRQKITFNYRRL